MHELHLLESLALHLVCHSLESHASMEDVVADRFVDWFKQHNGSQHESVALTHFEGMGRGAVALHDIAVSWSISELNMCASAWSHIYVS